MFSFLKIKKPDFIASSKDLLVDGKKTGWVEEEWYTREVSVPDWWNEECHRLLEQQTVAGKGFVKYCLKCDKQLPESGCIHKRNKKQQKS